MTELQSPSSVSYYCSSKFKVGEHRTPSHIKYKELKAQQLQKLIKTSNVTIDSMIKRLMAFEQMSAEEYFLTYREPVSIVTKSAPSFILMIASLDEAPSAQLTTWLATLGSMHSTNSKILAKIDRGLPVVNQMIYLVDPIVGPHAAQHSNEGPHLAEIYTVNLIDGIRCDKCNMVRGREDMSKHKLHPECIVEADKTRMLDSGMVKLEDVNHAIAVRQAGIHHEMVSEFWSTYVPTWVRDAIKIYNQNENYAGLPLEDFLKSMNPNVK